MLAGLQLQPGASGSLPSKTEENAIAKRQRQPSRWLQLRSEDRFRFFTSEKIFLLPLPSKSHVHSNSKDVTQTLFTAFRCATRDGKEMQFHLWLSGLVPSLKPVGLGFHSTAELPPRFFADFCNAVMANDVKVLVPSVSSRPRFHLLPRLSS